MSTYKSSSRVYDKSCSDSKPSKSNCDKPKPKPNKVCLPCCVSDPNVRLVKTNNLVSSFDNEGLTIQLVYLLTIVNDSCHKLTNVLLTDNLVRPVQTPIYTTTVTLDVPECLTVASLEDQAKLGAITDPCNSYVQSCSAVTVTVTVTYSYAGLTNNDIDFVKGSFLFLSSVSVLDVCQGELSQPKCPGGCECGESKCETTCNKPGRKLRTVVNNEALLQNVISAVRVPGTQ